MNQEEAKEIANKVYGDYYIVVMEYTEEIQCSLQAKECAKLEYQSRITDAVKDIKNNERLMEIGYKPFFEGVVSYITSKIADYKQILAEIEKL